MRRLASLAISILALALLPPTALAAGAPAAPIDLTAADGWGGVSVFLDWQEPDNNGSPIEQYWVERAQGGEFALVANLSAWQTYYHDGNVTAHTSYQYRVSAVNAYGPGAPAHVNWTTHDVPSAPRNLTAAGSTSGIALAWDAPLDPQGFTQYTLFRVVGGELWWLAQLDAANDSYFDDTMEPGETRTYTVAADNEYGSGTTATPATATRLASAPSAPQNFTAGDGWNGVSVYLDWDPPLDAGSYPIESYWLERAQGGEFSLIANLSPSETWKRDGNVSPHTSYQYRVRAVNAVGPGAAAELAWTTHDVPGAPQDLTAEGSSAGVLLSWNAPLAPEGADSYTVYRIVDGELWWLASTGWNSTSYLDNGIGYGETRTYTVAAENAYGPGATATPASGTRTGTPSAPKNFTATDGWGSPAILLTWNAPAEQGGAAIENYWLERANASSGFQLVANLSNWQNSYHDGNLSANTTYQYRVRAVNAYGPGAFASVEWTTGAMASAPREHTAEGKDDGIALSWLPPLAGAGFTSYTIYRVVDGALWWHASVASDVTQYLDTDAAPGETRTYVIAAANQYGPGTLSNDATGTRHDLPSAPLNLTASGAIKIKLQWNASADDGGSALLTYRIWRGSDPKSMTLIATQAASDTNYTDLGCGLNACYYRVSATNGVGEGPRSEYAFIIG